MGTFTENDVLALRSRDKLIMFYGIFVGWSTRKDLLRSLNVFEELLS